jgi:hypothetical protein
VLQAKLIGDAARNIVLHVRGVADQDIPLTPIFDIGELKATQKYTRDYIKVASAWWLIQEKMTLLLQWSENPEDLLFPMESRNAISFNRFVDPPDHSAWKGKIYLRSLNHASCLGGKGHFAFCLDFDR